eukprot:CAMPEP_0202708462 /NCGR_PEP_ID=MMETSP1385-20130828/20667_1 /ASSEMBLY_ACC=CAM_ASM_000861 /TAXON_ID=933848 /ORGANISM="Elphidium margaritaceum" /LENGTH=324 /DNA_ID=CAMNT_0049367437 /DNA_START=230 /DNA_END=1204 /DNA_ORIENTATION=-
MQSDKNHIKTGSSMILNMQNAYPISRELCSDLLLKGYLRTFHRQLYHSLPGDILPLLIAYMDPLLRWCLQHQEPKILIAHKNEYHLYLHKHDWKSLSIATKYMIHDIILNAQAHATTTTTNTATTLSTTTQQDIVYTIMIKNDSSFGSNLNDIQWLCQLIAKNNFLHKLHLSNVKHLLAFDKFHFLLQHSFLHTFNDDVSYPYLHEISINSYHHFNDDCFKLLLDVIDKKCPALTHLNVCRTDISAQSVKQLIAFWNAAHNVRHPLWSIDIEFCPKIKDDTLQLIWEYLQQHPLRKVYIKVTGKELFPDHLFDDQRLSVSVYPT